MSKITTQITSSRWWLVPTVVALLAALSGSLLDEYLTYIFTSWIIFGILALSLSFVWGKLGVLSLGQTAFYGLGAYAYGTLAINFAGESGDTLVWIMLAGTLVGGVAAAAVGYFIFYGRIGPVQTTIVTYTLILVLSTGFVGLQTTIGKAVIGGANGVTGIPPLRLGLYAQGRELTFLESYIIVIVIALVIYIGLKALLRSPFGLIVDALRISELRTELLGYDVRFFRLIVFVIGGIIAGIAGGLYAAWALYLNPSMFSVTQALLVPIWVLVGGLGTLSGAFIGSGVIGGLSYWLGGGAGGGQTTLILGLLLIFLVTLFPQGIIGTAVKFVRRFVKQPNRNSVIADWIFMAKPNGPSRKDSEKGKAPSAHKGIFETIALEKSFGGVKAVKGVDKIFHVNEIHCIIGPNGAGKSTYLSMLVGLNKPTSGTIIFEGKNITRWEPFQRVQAGIGIKLQVTQIFGDLSVWDNLWLAAYSRSREATQATEKVADVLQVIKLTTKVHLLAKLLSHGEQQWLDIGMVLCLEPRLILLDEPTAGMTPEETRRTADLIRELSSDATTIVVEHDMEFIRSLEAPITVLHQGGVFTTGSIEELRNDPRVLDIYLGRGRA